jgi:hypothetical protein
MYIAVVSLRPMFILDTNTNRNNAVTRKVTGRWWLSDEQEQVHTQ